MNQLSKASYNLILSIIGIAIALILSFSNLADNGGNDVNAKLIVGSAFIASCCFGVSIAFRPGWYRRRNGSGQHALQISQDGVIHRARKGHHPDCVAFDNHRIIFSGKVFCAGCLGIMIGSILVIALMAIYIIAAQYDLRSSAQLIASIGVIAIFLVYFEVSSSRRNRVLHIISNIVLMIGLLLVTIGMFEATGNAIVGLLGVLFGFLWMNTRISLSNWRHSILCRECIESCKSY